jgi:prepilin-type N-terminal cleavage/methylation domain-containing protein
LLGGRRIPEEGGFTLVEVLVSVTLVSIVLAALNSFFVSTIGLIRVQGGRQAATAVATEALEAARKLEPASLVIGRDQQSVDAQWVHPVTGVDLSGTQKTYDASAAGGTGGSANLPTTSQAVTLAGVAYQKYWYVGKCWQPKGGGVCSRSSSYAAMYRVIVAVTWREAACGGSCAYVLSMLVSTKSPDPLYNASTG